MTDIVEKLNDSLSAGYSELRKEAAAEIVRLRAKVAEMEKQEPVGVLHVGSYYGEELQDWEFEANQCACDKLNEAYVRNPMSLPLYALPGAQAQPAKNAVAYLDLGTGGYMDVGTDLTDEELATLPKGRHMLGIIGTYGVDGYVPAQPAPSVPDGWLRAIDEALVVANIGVAYPDDTYEQAKAKLDSLVGFHVDVATDPAVNGGWKLVPRPPTPTMVKAGLESSHVLNVHRVLACYDAMIDAAPEAKR